MRPSMRTRRKTKRGRQSAKGTVTTAARKVIGPETVLQKVEERKGRDLNRRKERERKRGQGEGQEERDGGSSEGEG